MGDAEATEIATRIGNLQKLFIAYNKVGTIGAKAIAEHLVNLA
jgi:hypothetical protein